MFSRHCILCIDKSKATALKKLKEKGGSSTRKLVGHGGPVYSAVFDPIAGTSGPPRHLLSSSADGSARLWLLDTMSNIAVYRSHENPVWDVQWSPMGVYFATASRDRTARLWTTDRVNPLRIFAGHLSDVDVSITIDGWNFSWIIYDV
jgi:transcription initiation factor TFIID subunit 5